MVLNLKDSEVASKRVVARVDWNVPLSPQGEVVDDFRIVASLETLKYLRKQKPAEIILIMHVGNPVVRPGDSLQRTMAGNQKLRVEPILHHAAKLLKIPQAAIVAETLPGSPLPAYRLAPDLVALENVRFNPGELANTAAFGKELASLGDVYVDEAFPEAHRAVASTVQIPAHLPHYAGLQFAQELEHLDGLIKKADKPMLMVLGGAKIHDKAPIIDRLLKKVDMFLLGGVMANTFLASQGVDVAQSVVEHDRVKLAKDLLYRAPQKFLLPIDFEWDRGRALDIGPQTVALFSRHLAKAKMIFWNGPMGWTDSGRARFMRGTEGVARAIAASTAKSVVAGGDTLGVIDHLKLTNDFDFRSTGGGATLAYLGGEELPGLAALEK